MVLNGFMFSLLESSQTFLFVRNQFSRIGDLTPINHPTHASTSKPTVPQDVGKEKCRAPDIDICQDLAALLSTRWKCQVGGFI